MMLDHAAATHSETTVRRIVEAVEDGLTRSRLLVLSDFDGTLCQLLPTPEAVFLPATCRALLSALAASPSVTVGLISGRRLEDVRYRAGLSGPVYYAGLHGLEIQGPGSSFIHPQVADARGLLQVIARSLVAHLMQFPGVYVENKMLSVALHTRGARPEHATRAIATLDRIAGPHLESGILRLLRGHCLLEVLPNIDWNKGHAVTWIRTALERAQRQPVWPIYIGDDLTDEDAFAAVGSNGVTVAVGERPSSATFRLTGPEEVQDLVHQIARLPGVDGRGR